MVTKEALYLSERIYCVLVTILLPHMGQTLVTLSLFIMLAESRNTSQNMSQAHQDLGSLQSLVSGVNIIINPSGSIDLDDHKEPDGAASLFGFLRNVSGQVDRLQQRMDTIERLQNDTVRIMLDRIDTIAAETSSFGTKTNESM